MTKFTDDQIAILKLNEGEHLVLAPPGSGKTELLSKRLNIAVKDGISPDKIICITFTNRASKNMLERIGENQIEMPFVGTLHNFGLQFLHKNKKIPANCTLLDEEDSKQLIQDAIAELKEDDIELRTANIDAIKLGKFMRNSLFEKLAIPSLVSNINSSNSNQLGLTSINPLSEYENKLFQSITEKYTQNKKHSCSIDFDDVLYLTLNTLIFEKNLLMTNYEWMQIDEVQDLSSLQWEIINRIRGVNCHAVYFGDNDQAIFSFMGASQSSLEKFTKACKKHYLVENFRSPQKLIDLFNTYAEKNFQSTKRVKIKLERFNNPNSSGSIKKILFSGNFDDEAESISREIIPEQIKIHHKIAILTRTNKEAEIVSTYLTNRKTEHFRVSGFDLFHRRTIKDALAFTRALRYPTDRLAWSRLVSIFGKIPSLRASRELVNQLHNYGIYPQDYLEDIGIQPFLDTFLENLEGQRCVVFDTETSGLNVESDDIIQIAAIELIAGAPTGKEFEIYIKTNKDLSESSNIHKISNVYLNAHGVSPEVGLKKFKEFAGNSILIGHNISNFDLKILNSNYARYLISPLNNQIYDTVDLSKRIYPNLNSYKLESLIKLLEVDGNNSHNAIDDVRANTNLLINLHEKIKVNKKNRWQVYFDSQKFMNEFQMNLGPFWSNIQSRMHKVYNLGELIKDFFLFANEKVSYKCDDQDTKHNSRLIRYLQTEWLKNKSFATLSDTILSQSIIDLSTYSEADLISENDRIIVSTIHKAKGLEFDSVVISGCVKDNFPHFYSRNNRVATEEDARLLYVALSRAKKEILITMHDSVTNRGGTYPRYPSPFLSFLD